MALDVGNKRIGVALSDPLGFTAQPLLTVHRAALKADLKSIARLVRRYEVSTLLVGLPLHASGEMSPQSEKTQAFAEALRLLLAEQMAEAAPVMEYIDERHTTAEAHRLLDRMGKRQGAADRMERAKVIDQAAAAVILEAWLLRQTPALLPDPDAVL